jgi:hypothetical protein
MTAIDNDTPRWPLGPWVLPGSYTLKLTVNGRTYTQPLTVRMDPRIKTSPAGLQKQFTLSMKTYDGAREIRQTLLKIEKLHAQLKNLHSLAGTGAVADSLASFEQEVSSMVGGGGGRRFRRAPAGTAEPTFNRVSGELQGLMDLFQGADAEPTTQGVAAFNATEKNLTRLFERWNTFQKNNLVKLNDQLKAAGLPSLVVD